MWRGGRCAPLSFCLVEFYGCDFSVFGFFDEFLSEFFRCGFTVCVNNDAAASKLSVIGSVGVSDFIGFGFRVCGFQRSSCFGGCHFIVSSIRFGL